jgi:hypothetical protein
MPFTYISVAMLYCICYVAHQNYKAQQAAARRAVRYA